MKPYIQEFIQNQYADCPLYTIFQLRSEYSWRLLELMMQYQGYLKQSQEIYREFTIDELRLCLNVPRGKYENRTDNFMKLIIKKPVTEINEKTAYDIRYEVERKGRGGIITKIKFFLSRKKRKKLKNKNDLTILDKNDLEAQYRQEIG